MVIVPVLTLLSPVSKIQKQAVVNSKLTSITIHLGKTRQIQTPAMLAVAVSPDGDRFVASFDDSTIRLFNANNGATIRIFRGHKQPVYGLDWNKEGTLVASGDERAQIYLWNPNNLKVSEGWRTHVRGIESLSFNSAGTLVLSTGRDDLISVYKLGVPKPIEKIYGHGANFYGAHFSPIASTFATATLTPNSRIYTAAGNMVRNLSEKAGQGALDAQYDPTGGRVAVAERDGTVLIFSSANGVKMGTLQGGGNYVGTATFSPDGRVIAASTYDGNVYLYDSRTLQKVASLSNESKVGSPVKFTSDGKYLISSDAFDHLQITPISPALSATSEKGLISHKTEHSYRRHTSRRKRT